MRTLLSDGAIVDDGWLLLRADEAQLPDGDIVVPLAVWQADATRFDGRNGRVGVWIDNTVEPDDLPADVLALPLLAVQFPAFNDGRGLSSAVLLRARRGYKGDLRAIGEVHVDQLSYMRRCGFSSFALAPQADEAAMREHLVVMSDYYQSSAIEARPLFRRR